MRPLFDPFKAQVLEAARKLVSRTHIARRQAYRRLFLVDGDRLSGDGEAVLADLRRFARASVSTFDPDPRVHALLEGRREVVWRILGFLNIDEATLIKMVEPEVETDENE